MRADNFRTNIDAYRMASNSFLTEEDVPGANVSIKALKNTLICNKRDGLNVGVLPHLGKEKI